MPYRNTFFEKDRPVHVISRALMNVFSDKDDCYRFIFYLYASNLGKRGFNISTNDIAKAGRALLCGETLSSRFVINEHPPLVEILDFSLVVNHDHFYLLPKIENAIPILMQRLNNSFAKSFNLKYNRKDAVFGSRYKGVVIKDDRQSYAVSRYVSIMNPLDVFQPGWRENGLKDIMGARKFLENYEFSSFPDKIGKRNSKILASSEILNQYSFGVFSGNRGEYENFVEEFLKERQEQDYSFLFLE